MSVPTSAAAEQRWVEHHLHTVVSLGGAGIDAEAARQFFARVAELEGLLSRFRPDSEISRVAAGTLDVDDADPAVAEVLLRCEVLRRRTGGDFEYEPRAASGRPGDPVLDPDAVSKGWIVEEAAAPLRRSGAGLFVNAGGDVTTSPRHDGRPWRVGVAHPARNDAVLGAFEVVEGAVATSGAYERGDHIRRRAGPALVSVTVVGRDLATADGLSTAVFASGQSPPPWWDAVDPGYGLLTLSEDQRLRWIPPVPGDAITWRFPARPGAA